MPFQSPVPIMLVVFAVLLLLPVRLSQLQLKGLAFVLWLTGGLILAWRGAAWMFTASDARPGMGLLALLALAAIVIGWGKGRFVLAKTSRRNIERIEGMTTPVRPIFVYSARSWIVISVMVGISIALNLSPIDPLWRGAINLGIGMGLIVSSMAYLKALQPAVPPSAGS